MVLLTCIKLAWRNILQYHWRLTSLDGPNLTPAFFMLLAKPYTSHHKKRSTLATIYYSTCKGRKMLVCTQFGLIVVTQKCLALNMRISVTMLAAKTLPRSARCSQATTKFAPKRESMVKNKLENMTHSSIKFL